jgi:hypothetical protein
VGGFVPQTHNFATISHSYYSKCKEITRGKSEYNSQSYSMLIIACRYACVFGAGSAAGEISAAGVVGAIDAVAASGFMADTASELRGICRLVSELG